MDMDSAYEAALGVVLGDAWENIVLDVTDFGTITEMYWAWTDPTANVGGADNRDVQNATSALALNACDHGAEGVSAEV